MQGYLIIGSGSTIKHYRAKIESFIKFMLLKVVAVNNVLPELRNLSNMGFWTNNGRFQKYYKKNKQHIVVSEKLYNANKNLLDNSLCTYEIIKDDINKWRNAGLRAIQYAHDNGAKNIYCVGFDGHSLVYRGDQHCYGKGLTDLDDMGAKRKDMKYERKTDDLIYSHMKRMRGEGVNFKVLTPTYFTEFYHEGML